MKKGRRAPLVTAAPATGQYFDTSPFCCEK